ncbi:hypothetical protein LPY66_02860 [Dehalobacter sp. DCM]|uniref:hypothetical protein n=1 Tax=Dehalobacter sp. DCM TaxID=2907827 RepID=UPI003081A2B6|nr:hypothetical protein LPY66_02860 [Dehalobacter sp. DCM]
MTFLELFWHSHPVLFIIIGIILLGIIVLCGLLYFGLSKPPTAEEKKKWYPGDDLLGKEPHHMRGGLAVTVDAPKEKIWPYLAQLGQRRAGFYSFGWLERLFGFHIYNDYRIVEEWQHMAPGQFVFYHQNGIGSEVIKVKEGSYFTSLSDSRRPSKYQFAIAFVPPFKLKFFAWSWNFILEDIGNGQTRFHTRCDAAFAPYTKLRWLLVAFFMGIPSFVMCKGMLLTIKKIAEGKIKKKFA